MDVSGCHRSLDKAALLISRGRYPVAIGLLSQIENDVKTAKSALTVEMMRLRESDMKIQGKRKSGGYNTEETLSISLPKELVSKLQMNNYVGYFYFEYLDKGNESLFLYVRLRCVNRKSRLKLYPGYVPTIQANGKVQKWNCIKIIS